MSLSLVRGSEQDREEAALCLTQFAETLGHGMSADQLDGYLLALADVPLVHLRLGLALGLKTLGRYGLPKPVEIRAAVDAALSKLPAPVDDRDTRVAVSCLTCADTGLAYVRDGVMLAHSAAHGSGLAVTPCPCRETNPAIARRLARWSRYSQEDQR